MPRPFVSAAVFLVTAFAYTLQIFAEEVWSSPPAVGGTPFYNADGTRIIRWGTDYTLVFESSSGRLVKTIQGAFWAFPTGDPALVALLQTDRSLQIVRLADGAVLATHPNVRECAFLDNGVVIYSQYDGVSPPILVKDLLTGALLKQISWEPNPKIRATGNRFIVEDTSPASTERNHFRIFNFENRELTSVTVTNAQLYDGVISERGDLVAAIVFQPEPALFVYDMKTLSTRWTRPISIENWTAKIVWIDDDRKILVHSASTMLVDAATGEIIWEQPKAPPIADVSPDTKKFIASDGYSTIHDVETGAPERINDFGFGGGRSMVISPDGKFITYGNLNGQLLCRELATGKIVWGKMAIDPTNSNTGVFRSVAGAPDGSFVMATRLAGPFNVDTFLMDAKTGELLKTIRTGGMGNWALNEAAAPAASSDNKGLVVGNIDTVVIADIESGANLHAFRPENERDGLWRRVCAKRSGCCGGSSQRAAKNIFG
jgi:WD40 repeat protein